MGIGRNWYKIIEQTHRTRQPEGCGRRYVPLPWEPWGDSAKAPLRLDCAQAQPPRVRMYVLHPIRVCVSVTLILRASICGYSRKRHLASSTSQIYKACTRSDFSLYALHAFCRQLSTYHRKDQLYIWKISLAFGGVFLFPFFFLLS